MEEDVGVKAPVTRMRHRLSVEQSEDVSSPATPTKKRGGRLAAKPQLELINENTQVSSPRKTRRNSVVDAEEKPVTPSRRSTRVKSNTSILLETLTAQTTVSPRAIRALRRNSQAGSDNEGPATPARTRRPRKDSASSVENQEPAPIAKPLKIPEIIITEEPENEEKPVNKSKSSPRMSTEVSLDSVRKSKRLSDKQDRSSGSYKSDLDAPVTSEENTCKEKNESKAKDESSNQLNKTTTKTEQTDELSESNRNLLKTLDTDSKVKLLNHNKSATDLNAGNSDEKKRNRTKSWHAVRDSPSKEPISCSDSELFKKKDKKTRIKNSYSDLENTTKKEDNIEVSQNKMENSQIISDSNSKRGRNKKSFTIDTKKTSNIQKIPNDNCSSNTENNNIKRDMAMLFESTPNGQTIVHFEDADSYGVNTETTVEIDGEDQCVPIVKHDIEFEDKLSSKSSTPLSTSIEVALSSQVIEIKETSDDISYYKKPIDQINDSCEPMDVDESIHEDVLHKSQNSQHDSNTKYESLTQNNGHVEQPNNNKSKRNSSISTSDTLDRSKNENKSTLVLSQINDVSITSTENLNCPKDNEVFSNSINALDNHSDLTPKTNLSLNDIKGTPSKRNNMQKLTMQTSTPMTSQATDTERKIEDIHVSSEKISDDLSKSIEELSGKDYDEPSNPKSKYMDDEAEEASDDYESGDSRDDEERQYEDENEIVERGETLGSDDDVSNDTDYEKDSFVVSSDAGDNELLSGSGEDLSMSDNELTMSLKSKTKYNKRKLKEQKNASREMFESRHKLNSSEAKSPTPKTKSNRMRIDSSLLESDEDVVVKTKKKNRLRLDSTLDTNTEQEEANKSLNKSNKKTEKSINNQSVVNENEITICNDAMDAKDPLIVEVKKEANTPKKDLNMSVIQFTVTQEIESVEVSESNSVLNQSETDPLQATLAHADSDSSESEEILQNYDSLLIDLNKNKKSKLNKNNISLNLGKKNKKVKDEPIIEQLNLTNTKKFKKTQKDESQDVVDSTTKTSEPSQDKQIEDSSNSIDLQLLFSEGSCGSGDENLKDGNDHQKDEEMFVPLRKSSGRTNIPESIDTSQPDTTPNESAKKKKKLKSSIMFNESLAESKDSEKTVLNESIKKKNRKASLEIPETEVTEKPLDIAKEAETVLNESIKKKKKRQSLLASENVAVPEGDIFFIDTAGAVPSDNADNISHLEPSELVSGSAKKKKNKKSENSQNITPINGDDDSVGAPVQILYQSDKACDQAAELQNNGNTDPVVIESGKKKKEKNSVFNKSVENTKIVDISLNKLKKRKHRTSDTGVSEDIANEGAPVCNESIKRNKQQPSLASESVAVLEADNIDHLEPSEVLPGGTKKKKNKKLKTSQNITPMTDDGSDGAPVEILYRTEKACEQVAKSQNTEGNSDRFVTESGKKKKKKKEKYSVYNQSVENTEIVDVSLNKSKKRKHGTSDTGVSEDGQEIVESGSLNESFASGSHKKKRKISDNDGANDQNQSESESVANDKRPKKKKKNRELAINFQNIAKPETTRTDVKKSKKRKERDDDNDNKKTKVSKDNSFQEIHLPTLPASILDQLDDNPKNVSEKCKVISTSNFTVESSRQKRAKPSNYLEESIYLDADSPIAKKEKQRMEKPKVLPFIPTASISDSGFTTNFVINKVSRNIQFVAEPAGIAFSKEKYLQNDKLKRLGTYDRYKKHIRKKLSKF